MYKFLLFESWHWEKWESWCFCCFSTCFCGVFLLNGDDLMLFLNYLLKVKVTVKWHQKLASGKALGGREGDISRTFTNFSWSWSLTFNFLVCPLMFSTLAPPNFTKMQLFCSWYKRVVAPLFSQLRLATQTWKHPTLSSPSNCLSQTSHPLSRLCSPSSLLQTTPAFN